MDSAHNSFSYIRTVCNIPQNTRYLGAVDWFHCLSEIQVLKKIPKVFRMLLDVMLIYITNGVFDCLRVFRFWPALIKPYIDYTVFSYTIRDTKKFLKLFSRFF